MHLTSVEALPVSSIALLIVLLEISSIILSWQCLGAYKRCHIVSLAWCKRDAALYVLGPCSEAILLLISVLWLLGWLLLGCGSGGTTGTEPWCEMFCAEMSVRVQSLFPHSPGAC